jgi:hypothetical protein
MGTGLELAKVYVTVRGDLSRLAGDLEDAQKVTDAALENTGGVGGSGADQSSGKLNAVASGVTSVSSSLDAMEKQAKQSEMALLALRAALAGVLYATGRWLRGTLETGSGVHDVYETIQAELEQLTGSVEVAVGVFDRLKAFAIKTGIAVPTIYEMSRAFIRAGKNGEQTVGILQLLGDASGGTEAKFRKLVSMYQRMENGTMEFRRAFQMLSRDGILTIKDLAEYFGVSEERARDMVKKGRVDFAEFKKILQSMTAEGGKYYGALDRMSNAGDRLSKSLQIASESLKEMLYAPLDPYLDAIAKAVTEITVVLTDFVEWGGETLTFMVAGAAAASLLAAAAFGLSASLLALAALVPKIIAGLALFGPQAIAIAFTLAKLPALILGVGAAIGALTSVLQIPTLLGVAWNYFISVIERSGLFELLDTLMNIWDQFATVVSMALDRVMSVLAPYFDWLGKKTDSLLMTIVGGAVGWLQAIADFVLDALEWLNVFLTHWNDIWQKLPEIMSLGLMVSLDVLTNVGHMMIDSIKGLLAKIIRMFQETVADLLVIGMAFKAGLTGGTFEGNEEQKWRDNFSKQTSGVLQQLDKKSGVTDPLKLSEGTMQYARTTGLSDLFLKMLNSKKELEGKRDRRKTKPDGTAAEEESGIDTRDKPGIFSIEDYGKKMQEMLLDPKTDKVVSAIDMGREVQERQLAILEELNRKQSGLV